MTLGSYRIGRATITLHPTLTIWDGDGRWLEDAEPAAIAVFLHEYLHYLHNCSTFVGVMQTLTTMGLTRLYAQTLDRDGRSTKQLGTSHQAMLVRLQGWWKHFVVRRDAHVIPDTTVAFANLTWTSQPSGPGVFQEARISTTAVLVGGGKVDLEFTLSVREVEESLAYIFETLVHNGFGGLPDTAEFVPYRVLPALAAAVAPGITDEDVFRLGCVALNCTNPTVIFMALLDSCATDGTEATLSLYATGDGFQEAHDDLERRIGEAENAWTGRGLMEDGVRSFLAQARALLDERRSNPWFELEGRPGATGGFMENVQALVLRHPPCDVMHGHPPTPVSFGTGDTTRAAEGRRCMDLAADAMFAHLDSRFEFRTDGTARSSCSHYGFCAHSTKDPTHCMSQPWTSIRFDDPRCLYSHSVMSLLAKIVLTPR